MLTQDIFNCVNKGSTERNVFCHQYKQICWAPVQQFAILVQNERF